MKFYRLFFLLFFFFVNVVNSQDKCYLIHKDGKFGFIDNKGNTVIQPIFNLANSFSEGLALVKNEKYFGYINTKGVFVIKPKFIKAEDFKKGIAKVYDEQSFNPYYINRNGEKVIEPPFSNISDIYDDFVVFNTNDYKKGIYNFKTKKVVVDSVYQNITRIGNYLTTLYNPIQTKDSIFENEGVFNLKTNDFIVPFGEYYNISDYKGGFTVASILSGEDRFKQVILDENGKVIFKENDIWAEKFEFRDGIGIINNKGYIDTKGNYLYKNDSIYSMLPFINGKAFIHNNDGYCVINKSFKTVLKELKYFPTISENYVIINSREGAKILDNDFKEILSTKFKTLYEIKKDRFLFSYHFVQPDSLGDDLKKEIYGITDSKGTILLNPILTVDFNQWFKDGVLSAKVDDLNVYVSDEGKIIWKETLYKKENVDDSDERKELYFKPKTTKKAIESNDIGLVLKLGYCNYDDSLYSMNLINNSNKKESFVIQDGKIKIILEAKDKNGEWKQITLFKDSNCGNSYATLDLESNKYWEFTFPKYNGDFSTVIRAKLYDFDGTREIIRLVSNEIQAIINSSLFYN